MGGELQLSAQVVLHRLVENQSPLFPATAKERELLDLVLGSIATLSTPGSASTSTTSSSIVARKAAVQGWETILNSWATRCDPVLGFDTLFSATAAKATANTPGLTAAVFRSGYTPLLVRLPAELVLEDFLPRLKATFVDALTAPTPDVRMNATTTLKKVNDMLQRQHIADSHTRIFAALGLDADGEAAQHKALLDVLMYYFSKK